eukprot:m.902465 g.902465  ORF g.902465 m.902465 type:complete len:428 (-) comp60065_c1_seq1:221-1504(-)
MIAMPTQHLSVCSLISVRTTLSQRRRQEELLEHHVRRFQAGQLQDQWQLRPFTGPVAGPIGHTNPVAPVAWTQPPSAPAPRAGANTYGTFAMPAPQPVPAQHVFHARAAAMPGPGQAIPMTSFPPDGSGASPGPSSLPTSSLPLFPSQGPVGVPAPPIGLPLNPPQGFMPSGPVPGPPPGLPFHPPNYAPPHMGTASQNANLAQNANFPQMTGSPAGSQPMPFSQQAQPAVFSQPSPFGPFAQLGAAATQPDPPQQPFVGAPFAQIPVNASVSAAPDQEDDMDAQGPFSGAQPYSPPRRDPPTAAQTWTFMSVGNGSLFDAIKRVVTGGGPQRPANAGPLIEEIDEDDEQRPLLQQPRTQMQHSRHQSQSSLFHDASDVLPSAPAQLLTADEDDFNLGGLFGAAAPSAQLSVNQTDPAGNSDAEEDA